MQSTLDPTNTQNPHSLGGLGSSPDQTIEPREAILSIEGLGLQNGLLPIHLLRETCSPDAERVVRLLGRVPFVADPWLPVTTLGPLLVMAHHNPRAADLWGVPPAFCVRVLISAEQYQSTRKDLVARFSQMPIAQSNPLEGLQPPRFNESGLVGAFEWLLSNYPFEPNDVSRIRSYYEATEQKGGEFDIARFNSIQKHLGVVLNHIVTQGKTLTFNPADCQRQNHFPLPLLERHNVYPAYIGRQGIYLLSEVSDCYAFEDEWISMGQEAVRIIPVLADPSAIREALARAAASFDPASLSDMEGVSLTESNDENVISIMPEDMAAINPSNPNHSAEELLQWALFTAIRCRASDLHIEKFYSLARFRARLDGNMRTILTAPESMLSRFIALIKNYAALNQDRQSCQDGRFALAVGRRRVDVRVAAVPTRREFQKIIMRFLDKQDGVKRLSDFNLSQRQVDILNRAMTRDQGLILVTGPTGSGKTTTLYALLNSVNDESVNIQTIEDPIEYEIEGINQTQTNNARGLDFANGLRALLRADPDIILIGESRDSETANAAVNAALTGHLVLTTLHANDSLRAVSRLTSMGVEKYLLSDSLALSQAQRLVRRLCGYCKKPTPISMELQEHLARQGVITQPLNTPIYVANGCDECHGTGYSGRVALMELCELNTDLRDLIEEGAPMSALRAAAFKNGFLSLYQEGLMQVIAGHTTTDEIRCLSYTAI
jgi:type II secretory ATPase GspE/PulE/Tfp pilus assembly ATPase PilB-like protein